MSKIEFEKIEEKIDKTTKKVDIIMHNRLIIAIFMIVDGVNFIINPSQTINFMALMVAFLALCASIAGIILNIKSKKRDIKSIIISSILVIICIVMFIYPKILAINLRVILATFISLNGIINILNILKLNKISLYINNIENDIKNKFHKIEINKDITKGIKEQTEKVINPYSNFINKTQNKAYLYFIFNIISIILGVFLFTNNNVTLILCGIILIYTGGIDFLMFAKSTNILAKIKEKNLKSIFLENK